MSEVYDKTSLVVHSESRLILTTEKIKPRKKLPPFYMGGRKQMYIIDGKPIPKGYPREEVILEFNAAERWFYKLLMKELNPNLKINIPNAQFKQPEQNKKSSAVKSLVAKGLIKKIKREWYMLNPEAFIFPNEHESNMKEWNKL